MRIAVLLCAASFLAACAGETKATCTAGQVECNGATLRTCNALGTGWSETVCDVACVSGACQVCTPNQHKCEGTNALSCNPDGTGWGQQPCQNGCDSTTGMCKSNVCTPNDKKCSGNSIMICNATGSGYDTQSCQYGCDATTVTCKTQGCEPGTVSCTADSKLTTCKSDGTGITEQVCQFGCDATANPNKCKDAACAAGSKRCSPTEPKQVQICKPDQTGWNPGPVCPGTCLNGECQAPPTCVAGEETCRPNVQTHRDEIDTCVGGAWQLKEACTTGNCVDQGGTPKKFACGTCWQGERDCDSSQFPEVVLYCDDPMAGWTEWYSCWESDWCISGSCATPLELAATKADNLKLLAQSFLQCWYWYKDGDVTKDEMCYILDGSNQSTAIDKSEVGDWVCDSAVAADFADFAPYWATTADDALTLVKDLFGCGFWNNWEVTWKWNPLPAGTFLDACMWYRPSNNVLFDDEDYLDHCENFVQ